MKMCLCTEIIFVYANVCTKIEFVYANMHVSL